MANTDPQDKRDRWTFVRWMDGIKNFFGMGSGTIIIPAGAQPGGVAPQAALIARARETADRKQGEGVLCRKDEAAEKNQVWDNDIAPLVWQRLRNIFHPENFKRMKLQPSLWTNQMRRIVNDISILYETPATRRLVKQAAKGPTSLPPPARPIDEAAGGTEEVPADEPTGAPEVDPEADANAEQPPAAIPQDPNTGDPDIDALADVLGLTGAHVQKEDGPLEEFLTKVDLDVVLERVEKLARIHEAVWVRPFVRYEGMLVNAETGEQRGDPDKASLSFITYDPSTADIVPDPTDPARALAWFYFAEEADAKGQLIKVIHFFTADGYWKFDHEWKVLASGPNELGRLPVTVFRKELPSAGSYFVRGNGRDLFEATLEFCLMRSIQNSRYRDSGFKQLVMVGVEPDDIPDDQVMGGPAPIYVGGEGSATVLDMEPQLQQMTDTIKDRAIEQAAAYGITGASYKADASPQSGFAKKLDRDNILKENRRIRKFFAEGEKDLYQLIAKTLEISPVKGLPQLPTDAEFEVDFGEPSFTEDPKEQSQQDAIDLKLNKTNIVEILRRDNPDASDVELIQQAYRNKRINEAFISTGAMKLLDVLAHKVGVGGMDGSSAPANDPNAGGDGTDNQDGSSKPAPIGFRK